MFSSLVLACMQAGFAIGSNNQVGPILAVQFNSVDPTFLQTLLTSAVIVGMVLGSWLSGWILEYGRRRTIIIACLGIIVSASCSLALNLPTIIVAKFFQGIAAANIINASNLFIIETSPANSVGLFGSFVNIGIVLGLSIYFL